ncbi:efflux RND transporter permease subunit [bacterium]|nr:efflux RND transporter permease subunit [bacterium]
MIERLIEASIRNRFLVLILAAGLTIFGVYAVLDTPVDAIPDLSENQVIVFTDWMGRSPREIEDQVTYPLSRKLQGLAGVKTVRSSSEFNFSMITVIFNDGVDFYFARQRVSERLDQASTFLPPGVVPYLAPDATALGQVFWYTVETGKNNPIDPGRLWAINKFYITQQLSAVAGVADVAVVGGMPLEYQIDVQPEKLRAYGISLGELFASVSRSNMPSGGGVVQKNNAEYLVRGIGWIANTSDIENTVVKETDGTPIYVKNVAKVQLGTQFRRSVYEKNGSEAVGGVVLMRHGENPLAVTESIKNKIQEMQPGLPKGVHIVPAYDRTRLINGAIHTLGEVMWHEMVIASIAILLVLMHVRSVFVICITLPLAVIFSFLLMWILRTLGIIDIQANIMSLAGITISIGILVDQAIVMTENATHELKRHFGNRKVTGDTLDIVIPACRLVGRPIFFSVMIMLVSFIPVFMLSGREGKLFHPLAFTKSFALLGVAIISVTVVPALIPMFLRGHLRDEQESWLVRSLISVYKPLLTWALPRLNLVMWAFAALLILAAGLFPLQAVIGLGASEEAWRTAFLTVLAIVTGVTVLFVRGFHWQLLSLTTLVLLGLWAYQFPKIGVSFMPALDEGTTLDMPVTVPRASVTQATDDLKARDALLRGFPEVESVVGKAGRADTPTDPAPLDMVETFVNYRPHELWPKRVVRYVDAAKLTESALNRLIGDGFVVEPTDSDERNNLVNDATQRSLERFDESMRELALARYGDIESDLEIQLVRFVVNRVIEQVEVTRQWTDKASDEAKKVILERLTSTFFEDYGYWLSRSPAQEDVTSLVQETLRQLKVEELIHDEIAAQSMSHDPVSQVWTWAVETTTSQVSTLSGRIRADVVEERGRLWSAKVSAVNWELFDFAVETFPRLAIEELLRSAKSSGLTADAPKRQESEAFAEASIRAQLGRTMDSAALVPLQPIIESMMERFRREVFLWRRIPGPKGDLVDDEMGRVLQVPGWSNIFTQPIINRIEMLSTGVRTDIGVKVFGPDLTAITRVCRDIESTLKPISGARDVVAAPIMGKGYIEVKIDREKAARYGISVEDIQSEIEVALAGTPITYTVEQRNRFPVRIRYARTDRRDEESIGRLLVGPKNMGGASISNSAGESSSPTMSSSNALSTLARSNEQHNTSPGHATGSSALVPLSTVADIKIVEGPAMIRSENGRLLNYVTLNVRGRDIVGFVDEAQRSVAQKVVLPEGIHIEWSGEFEHQVRAARTLRFVFPMVIILIFLMLYWTYRDLADASLMMLAVPEALAGGAFFLYLFPKIVNGWDAPPLDFSVAVWVGFIACFGMATETGIIMLVYLREAIDRRGGLEKIASLEELRETVIEGAVHRLRPKLLTEGVAIIAIFPMVFADGVGAEILAPMALPVLGGLLISDEVVDLFLPVRFYWVRRARWLKLHERLANSGSDLPP